jgi:hypothetical protein
MSEGKKKKQEEVEKPIPATQPKATKEKLTFDSWASLRLSQKDRKSWLKEPVKKFFESLGLKNEEEIETFDLNFKKF